MPRFDLLNAAPDLVTIAAEIGATVTQGHGWISLHPYGGLWSSRSDGPMAKNVAAIRQRLERFARRVKSARAETPTPARARELLGRLDGAEWLQPGYAATVTNEASDRANLHRWPLPSKYDADAIIDGERFRTDVMDSREAALAELRRLVEARWPDESYPPSERNPPAL